MLKFKPISLNPMIPVFSIKHTLNDWCKKGDASVHFGTDSQHTVLHGIYELNQYSSGINACVRLHGSNALDSDIAIEDIVLNLTCKIPATVDDEPFVIEDPTVYSVTMESASTTYEMENVTSVSEDTVSVELNSSSDPRVTKAELTDDGKVKLTLSESAQLSDCQITLSIQGGTFDFATSTALFEYAGSESEVSLATHGDIRLNLNLNVEDTETNLSCDSSVSFNINNAILAFDHQKPPVE